VAGKVSTDGETKSRRSRAAGGGGGAAGGVRHRAGTMPDHLPSSSAAAAAAARAGVAGASGRSGRARTRTAEAREGVEAPANLGTAGTSEPMAEPEPEPEPVAGAQPALMGEPCRYDVFSFSAHHSQRVCLSLLPHAARVAGHTREVPRSVWERWWRDPRFSERCRSVSQTRFEQGLW
jgi:hypothetical protein